MTWLGKVITQNTVWALEKMRLAPEGTYDVGEALKVAADALVAGGREKLFTPMRTSLFFAYNERDLIVHSADLFVCRKPEQANGH